MILAEFGDKRHPDFPDQDTDPDGHRARRRFDGPLRNQIPEPDRTKDNSTVWQTDYNRQHYQDLYFGTGKGEESVKTYYETQSSGRYTVDGRSRTGSRCPYNEARYGRDESYRHGLEPDPGLADRVGRRPEEGRADRRADQGRRSRRTTSTTATTSTATATSTSPTATSTTSRSSTPAATRPTAIRSRASDAIWSHRWYAFGTDAGLTGPERRTSSAAPQVGNTGVWVGDYTRAARERRTVGLRPRVRPRPRSAGRLRHQRRRRQQQRVLDADGAEPTQRQGRGRSAPVRATSARGRSCSSAGSTTRRSATKQKKTLDLGPQEYNSEKAQAAVVVLPKKKVERRTTARPASGTKQFFSGSGDDLANSMTTDVDLTGKTGRPPSRPRSLLDRGGLRLRVRPGVDRRRDDVDVARRHDRRARRSATDSSETPALDGEQA